MAGDGGDRSLEETPTWAVGLVTFVMVGVSVLIEYMIHLIGKWLKSKHKRALNEALEKIKSELMLLGFISLMLTVLQSPISKICISAKLGNTWLPCTNKQEHKLAESEHESLWDEINGRRRLLLHGGTRRVLAAAADKCASKGKVPLVSLDGVHQLHMFIFVLAIFHVLYCVTTLVLGRAKMRRWKAWEKETKTAEYKFNNDPERFRFARETTFGRRHLSFWTTTPSLLWFVCFFRQFIRSVPKVDYLTLRHGFIMAHLTPQSEAKFDFQKYINRSLEKDFKVVVGISPPMWMFAVFFLLFNTHGWYSYLWLPFLPLIIILLVGTKLQVIITKMGLRIQDRNEIVKGVPIVEPNDDLFWFNHPRLLLFLINFVLFQNAFELAFFAWTWYMFGLRSCFHDHVEDIIIRFTMGVLIQVLCSYVTLPLYALVTQMGSNMKPTIFDEKVATALKGWHHTAKKRIKDQSKNGSANITPTSSRPGTPSRHGMSPVHPRNRSYYQSEIDMMSSAQSTVRDKSDFEDLKDNSSGENNNADRIGSSKPPSQLFSNHNGGRQSRHEPSPSSSFNNTTHQYDDNNVELKIDDDITTSLEITHVPLPHHEVNVKEQIDFSFDKRLD